MAAMKRVYCSRSELSLWLAAEKQHRQQTNTRTPTHTYTHTWADTLWFPLWQFAKEWPKKRKNDRGVKMWLFFPVSHAATSCKETMLCFLFFYWNTPLCLVFFHSYNGCELIYTRFPTILHQLREYSCANQNQPVMLWSLYEKRADKTSGLLTGCDCLSFYPQGAFSTHTTQFVRYSSKHLFAHFSCATYAALTGSLESYKFKKTVPQKQKQKFSWFAHSKKCCHYHMFHTTGAYLG